MGLIDKLQQKKSICNMSETAKNIVEACKYLYQYFHKNTPIDTIIKAYEKAFERGKKEGFTPVMVPVYIRTYSYKKNCNFRFLCISTRRE